jgi:hypothetical protein
MAVAFAFACAGALAVVFMEAAPAVIAGASPSARLFALLVQVNQAGSITNSNGFMFHPVSPKWFATIMAPPGGPT